MAGARSIPWSLALVVLLIMGATEPVRSEDKRSAANALYRAGNELYARGKHQQALDKYRKARELFPSYKLDLNIATSLHELGWYSEAAPEYERFLANARGAPAKVIKSARQKLEQVRRKVASVQIRCAAKGVTLQVDGRDLGPTPFSGRIYLMPGVHRISAVRTGHRPFAWKAGLRAGQHELVQVKLIAQPKPPVATVAPPPAAPLPAPVPAHHGTLAWPAKELPRRAVPVAPASDDAGGKPRRGRLWTYVTAGCAVAALGVGIGLGASVLSEADAHNSLDPATGQPEDVDLVRERLDGRALGANIMFGAAGVLAATSVVLFFVEGRSARRGKSKPASAGVRLLPLVGQAQGVTLSTDF